jgi:hypothetical protein
MIEERLFEAATGFWLLAKTCGGEFNRKHLCGTKDLGYCRRVGILKAC